MGIIYEKKVILEKLNSKEFLDIIKKYSIGTVILFGSICTDEFNDYSDVDIAILSENKSDLDNILEIELFLENFLKREIDVIDLNSSNLDIIMKANILNTGRIIYSDDNNKRYNRFYNNVERTFRENENFMYFRRRDLLS